MAGMKCTLTIERSKGFPAKETLKAAILSLARNEFREVLLVVEAKGKTNRYVLKHENLVIHRKFAAEGKLTIDPKDLHMKFMLCNAPPHQLVQFVKTLVAKLAGNKDKTPVKPRQKLLSTLPSLVEDISPVTLKDVQNLKNAEKGRNGLLKMNMGSPVSSGRAIKRTRLSQSPLTTNKKKKVAHQHTGRYELTAEQKSVLQAIRAGNNVFFTGGAGVGKSFLINKCIGDLPPNCTFVTASTGVAAYHIGGITLHSFAGIGGGAAPLEQCVEMAKRRKNVAENWRKCKHLIIDEISMVDGRYFTKLEAVARAVRNNDKPFGGIQLILAGDFLQLPPVTKSNEKRVFCFQTTAWSKCMLQKMELTVVKRQNDQRFIDILNALRIGRCSQQDAKILQNTKNNSIGGEGILATKLCTHTEEANQINRSELANLSGEGRTFAATDSDPALASFMDSHTPVESRLVLKIGAQVMLMKNQNVAMGLVNGARGMVTGFNKASGAPVVKFVCGLKDEVQSEKWMVKAAGGVTLTRKQVPLKLAWAFSIHKSQGMTLDCVEMSLGRVFECGQAYVALSRARSLDTVRILDFTPGCIEADPKVIRFYRELRDMTPMEPSAF